MADPAQPDRDAPAGIGAQLERYFAAPGDTAALEAARDGLRRLIDTLKAARRNGAAAFCAELEAVLGELAAHPGLFSAMHRDVLQRALAALARHLGTPDSALLLFPEYQELQQLRGLEMSFELDLFYPDLSAPLPQRVLDLPQEGDAASRLKAVRSRYQQGLLHWLRRDDAPTALQAMQQALEGALRCMPQDGSRAFWWVAGGLFDCLRLDGMPAELNVNRLLGRIDQQMRAAVEEHAGEAQPVMNEMLYLIGRSHPVSDLVDEIRRAYALDSCLPAPTALPPRETARALEAMRGQLQSAEESWERCAQGNRAACEIFIGHTARLAAQAVSLDRNALQYLTGRIHALSQHAKEPEHARLIAPDMAMFLRLLGGGIRRYGRLDGNFQKEVRLLSDRIQAAARRQPEDMKLLDELVRLHCLLERDDAMGHLLNEMLANLQYLGQGLSAFFRDPAARGELGGLLRLSGQIRGGLYIASLERAERLQASLQDCIRRFAQSDDVPEPTESLPMADAVGALEDYLRQLAHGEAGDASPLQAALEGLAGLRQAHAAPEPPRVPAKMARPAGEDQELLEVFLEEAQEVLHTLHSNLEACRVRPDNREPLVNIRRGFHTLKGSGRMVGLTDLGEVAWSVERALNKWLQDNMPATPMLLHFIDDAQQRFAGWVDALNSQGGVSIEAGDLIAAAQQVESGGEPAAGAAPEAAPRQPSVPEQPSVPASPAAPAPAEKTPAPPPPVAAAPPAEKPPARDEIDAQLLPVFLEEAGDLCPRIGAGLQAWRGQPDDEQQAQLLGQLLHTLKGSARMAGAMRIGGMAHEMEERVLSAAGTLPQAAFWDALEGNFDRIAALLEELRGEKPQAVRRPEQRTAEHATLRVRADLVERLTAEAGEIGMARARMETEMRAFKEGLLELTGSVTRLRRQLREIEMQAESRMQAGFPSFPLLPPGGEGDHPLSREREGVGERAGEARQFDPLEFDRFTRLQELTRFMNESVHDVQTVQQALLKNFDAASTALAAQARLNRELQQNLLNMRMVPFASIGERLHRMVRQTAKELGKRAGLELSGAELEVDRGMLERMTAPFEHLLRNALVHGIEAEAVRAQRGKNPAGKIRLALRHEGNEVVFELGDDGAGLDLAALREKAVAKGLLKPDEMPSPQSSPAGGRGGEREKQSSILAGDERLAQLVFVSGLSTAAEVTEVAGRGIGMDVVCGEVAALGGRIEVATQTGLGARFTIRLPLTLAVTHVLMLRSGKAIYAIPSATVEQVRQVKPAELEQFRRDGRIEWQGHSYPLHYLPHLLGDTRRSPEAQGHNPLVLLRSGGRRIALHVDALLGNQEAIVKNTGPQLARLPVIAGATVQGDGTVALILNPAQLAQHAAAPGAGEAAPEKPGALVMVVDDSLTVRKVTTRLLTRAGYRVATARDGMDALEQLGETLPDVMLLDIEMPRMDGFELTKHLRRNARTQKLPIVMITSRAADKHRDYALQLGVNAYLGKPYQEEELLRQIAGFAPLP